MNSTRTMAIAVGILFLITHATSVAARFMYGPLLEHPEAAGGDSLALAGAVLEVILALAIVGTAAALYPIAKLQNGAVAVGYVALRTLEAGVILAGVVSVLTLVSMRTVLAGSSAASAVFATLVSFQNWTFIVGPGFECGANTVLMAYIMYRSRLVPRFIAILGLVGGPLVFAVNLLKLYGVDGQFMPWIGLSVVPIFAWEVCLAIYLITKGFRGPALARLVSAREPALI